MSTEKHSITRHGNILSNFGDSYISISKKVLELINKSIKSETEKNKNILLKIKNAFINIDEKKLRLINAYNNDSDEFYITHQEINWLLKNNTENWIKYLLYRYKFKILPLKKIVTEFPEYVLIEPVSICNLRCIMCFQVDKSFSSNKAINGFISLDLFKDIIDQIKENECNAVTLASRGEPTLHKEFDKIAEILSDSKILDCKLNTNATVMNEKKINEILSANFSEVVFSVDAGTKKTYEEIRVKGKFERVVKNIELFNNIRAQKYPDAQTITRIAGVKVKKDQDINQMTNFWEKLVDEVSIKEASPRWDSYNNKKNKIIEPCMNLWTRTYVWYDGTVNPCDFDYKSNLAVGSLKKHDLKTIWHNDKYNQLRNDHLNKKRNCHNPCDRCPITN